MIVVFLLCVIAGMPAAGQILDVCTTCHANATCEDKADGSGKVCNCKYGFVGNGRTFCQDKDECQIGAIKICGQHTKCHNTYGSYYCTCLSGYNPSNNLAIFIPNDGTHCQDIDECRITGLCGEGGWCRNLEGSFECSCHVGYQVDNGTEPFHPHRDKASCKVVDCGQPASVEDTVLLSVTRTTYGGVATWVCDEGFIWGSGHNISMCRANGLWSGPTMVCEEVDCGSPPAHPHSHMLWNKSSRMGSEVVYQCNSGYHNVGKGNVSICTAAGQWEEPPVLCQEILCGDPPVLSHTGQVRNGSSTPGSTVTYYCKIGFYQSEGNNVSLCTINGSWTKPNISCKEVLCGPPPSIPHSIILWDEIPTVGSQIVYQCKSGYRSVGEGNISVCTARGEWDEASLLCQEINCQEPVHKPHSKILWNGTSHIGSVVYYQCDEGYHSRSLKYDSVCGENGLWEDVDLWCEEINCGPPLIHPHTNLLWDHTSRPGSVVLYECMDGFYPESGNNISVCSLSGEWGEISLKCQAKCGSVPFLANSEVVWHNRSVVIHRCVDGYHSWRGSNISVCGSSGEWQTATLRCIEINCGPPLIHPHTNLLWDHTSRPGSVVLYECMDGFYPESGNNISVCSLSGEWGEISLKCQAKCGSVPFLANSEVVWHNRSVVIHRCVDGYHSWRGSNISVCGSSGEWQTATLRCIEIKPAINHVHFLNERCLHWKAEKYEEDSEVYKVTYTGTRDYQRSFRDKRKQFVSSKAEQLTLCLHLLPATNYSISIIALSARFTASITTNTSLPVPPVPIVYYGEFETPVPTLRLHRSANTLDPISLYQVYVLPVEDIMVFDCSSPGSPDLLRKNKFSSEYIAAQILIRQVGTQINFTVGDGLYYGGFHNAPLEKGRTYYIILRVVSQWKTAMKSSCVLWAQVRGMSYVLMVSSLAAAASVGLVAFAILGGYSCNWLFKKT